MKGNFNHIATLYERLAQLVFGKAWRQSQLHFLNHLENKQHILVLGGGAAFWLNGLVARYPHLKITFIEASDEMITLAKAQLTKTDNVTFLHATHESIPAHENYDGVVLFYFLDLFHPGEIKSVIQDIRQHINYEATWMIADFVNDQWWHKAMLVLMYTFFRVTTGLRTHSLPDWRAALQANGLVKKDENYFYGNFICSQWYQAD